MNLMLTFILYVCMYVCILLRTLKQINAFVNEQYSEKQINSVKIKWINLNNVFKCQSDEL